MRPNPHETAHWFTFIEEILNGKLNFLCSANMNSVTSIFQGFYKSYILSPSMFLEIRNNYSQRASVSGCLHITDVYPL